MFKKKAEERSAVAMRKAIKKTAMNECVYWVSVEIFR